MQSKSKNGHLLEAESQSPSILNRRIKFGVHNGHRFIGNEGKEWKILELITDENIPDTLVGGEPAMTVENFIRDPQCALICCLEYIINVPSNTILKREVGKPIHVKGITNHLVLTLGCQIHLPFSNGMKKGALEQSQDAISLCLVIFTSNLVFDRVDETP